MLINNQNYRTIRRGFEIEKYTVKIIDQRLLPFRFNIVNLLKPADYIAAIKEMAVRGAPLIGICGAYGVASAAKEFASDNIKFYEYCEALKNSRPTAVNLKWAVDLQINLYNENKNISNNNNSINDLLFDNADRIAEDDVKNCQKIGMFGCEIIKNISLYKKESQVNILTHCNAGWLATVDNGTALSPIFEAQKAGIDVHVYVDETRPRNQGAGLTAFELKEMKIPYTVIVDNAGGLLMMKKKIDMVIVGADRISVNGDVVNKIGTYLKALAAKANNIPFYVAAPTSTIDYNMENALLDTEIEERNPDEVSFVNGLADDNTLKRVRIVPEGSQISNLGFDICPAELISGIITEKGIVNAKNFCILELKNK